MKKKEFASLARRLSPHVPGTIVHGPMLLIPPVTRTLRGLYFEGSSFDAKSFYIWVFWMPLCVPSEHVYFNLGRRVRGTSGGDRWNAGAPQLLEDLVAAIRSEAIPLLSLTGTQTGEIEAARAATAGNTSPYTHQALAYVLAQAGETQAAVDTLAVLLGFLDPAVPWQAEMGARARLLKEGLVEHPEEVARMLDGWRLDSIRNLGLGDVMAQDSGVRR
jgi:hypothetical protein